MEKAAGALNKVITDALKRVSPEEAPVSAWPFACGSNVAHRTRAIEFKKGVLQVEVPDKAWKAQLSELAPRYLASLNAMVGHTVQRIRFVLPGEVRAAEVREEEQRPQ
jgi:predicted nucleic acid-binding Zn ribbon protein